MRRPGFTLIEVMGAVLLTSVVIAAAVAFYLQLSQASEHAIARSRTGRAAIATLDRVARDLEGAYLLAKPPEVDPLEHPWLFVAESRYSSSGADHLKFITHDHRPRGYARHASPLAEVSYALFASEGASDGGEVGDGGYELLRRVIPRLPEALDREFPRYDDEEAMLVAEGVAEFSVLFQDESGEWVDEWDSTLLLQSSRLPVAAEIRLSLLADEGDPDEFDEDEEGGAGYVRRVLIPVRPISLEEMLEAEQGAGEPDPDGEDDEEESGLTLGDCKAANPEAEALLTRDCADPDRDPGLDEACEILPDNEMPWSEVKERFPDVVILFGEDCGQ